jgi:hypothetical protein
MYEITYSFQVIQYAEIGFPQLNLKSGIFLSLKNCWITLQQNLLEPQNGHQSLQIKYHYTHMVETYFNSSSVKKLEI